MGSVLDNPVCSSRNYTVGYKRYTPLLHINNCYSAVNSYGDTSMYSIQSRVSACAYTQEQWECDMRSFKAVNVLLIDKHYTWLKKRAYKFTCGISAIVREAIAEYINKQKRGKNESSEKRKQF